jgi:hypothetical protein
MRGVYGDNGAKKLFIESLKNHDVHGTYPRAWIQCLRERVDDWTSILLWCLDRRERRAGGARDARGSKIELDDEDGSRLIDVPEINRSSGTRPSSNSGREYVIWIGF